MTFLSYVGAGEAVPNLREAYSACSRLMVSYPLTSCREPGDTDTIASSDFTPQCVTIAQSFSLSPLARRPVNVTSDAATLSIMKAAGLSVKIEDFDSLKKLAANPKMAFVIDGTVYDASHSLEISPSVRCAVDTDSGLPLGLSPGQVLIASAFFERFVSGTRGAQIRFVDANLALVCMKINGHSITLGELKTAFGKILTFQYVDPDAAAKSAPIPVPIVPK